LHSIEDDSIFVDGLRLGVSRFFIDVNSKIVPDVRRSGKMDHRTSNIAMQKKQLRPQINTILLTARLNLAPHRPQTALQP